MLLKISSIERRNLDEIFKYSNADESYFCRVRIYRRERLMKYSVKIYISDDFKWHQMRSLEDG